MNYLKFYFFISTAILVTFFMGCVSRSPQFLEPRATTEDSAPKIEPIKEVPLLSPTTIKVEEDSHLVPFLWIMGISLIACFIPLIWNKSRPYRLKWWTVTRDAARRGAQKIQEKLKK